MQISQEIISTVESPETHSRQLKNSQFHTVKTLYPVGSGVIRMWRQRKKTSWELSGTHILCALSHDALHIHSADSSHGPVCSILLLSSAPPPRLHPWEHYQTQSKLRLAPRFISEQLRADHWLQRQILSRMLHAKHVTSNLDAGRGKPSIGT